MDNQGRTAAIALLQQKQVELIRSGSERLPQRSDFTDAEIVQIKAYLGPFPRALEAAGLKQGDPAAVEKKREKRIAAKRRRTAEKIRRQEERSPARQQSEKGV